MCLINFQFHEHLNYKLIVAANRDEFYDRPTASAHFWEDEPEVLGGRDLLQMGTWLGITKEGRFAALTNYRDPKQTSIGKISRGEIVKNYLTEDISPVDYLKSIHLNKDKYNGFNVIVGNPEQLFYYNNIEAKIVDIPLGTHGLSNRFLDTPWPKVLKGTKNLKEYCMSQDNIQLDELFHILSDSKEAQEVDLPETGISIDLERKLSPLFINIPDYGTRSSTVLLVDNHDQVTFSERTYTMGKLINEQHFTFRLS